MAIYVCDNPPPPGNYGRFQVYKDRGRTIGRVPNPLDGKRVKNAPEFANTRKYAHLLAAASPLAAAVYRTLPDNRQRHHYQQLAGKAIQWLKEGNSNEAVLLLLTKAAEVIRKQLRLQKIKALIAQKQKGSKPVFAITVAVTVPLGSGTCPYFYNQLARKLYAEGTRRRRRSRLFNAHSPHLVPQ